MGQEKTRTGKEREELEFLFFFFEAEQNSSRGSRYFCARQTNAKNVERPVRTLPPNVQDSSALISRRKNFFIHRDSSFFRGGDIARHLSRKLFKIEGGGGKKKKRVKCNKIGE